jgi:hypothetical protein
MLRHDLVDRLAGGGVETKAGRTTGRLRGIPGARRGA